MSERRSDGGPSHRDLADRVHAGLVQHVTALSLAVDTAQLHAGPDGDPRRARSALVTARRLADLAVLDCRELLDELRADGGGRPPG